MSLKRIINVAVIGVGNMGRHHARNYFELPEANLVAVSDSRPEIGKEIAEKFNCKFYQNYRQMLRDEKIEAVSIVVPTKLHKQMAVDSIRAGKHILVEKPIASTLRDGQEIISEAKKRGVVLVVGHIERFNPAVRRLKDLIDQKKLGQIISIIAKRVGPSVPQIKDSGVLIDLAVHDIDIMAYLLEKEPTKIYVNGGRALSGGKEDYAEIFLNYGPISGYIQVNWITPVMIRELCVTGTKGYASLNYITQELNFFQSKYKKEYNDFGDFVIKFGTPQKISIPIEHQEPLKLELKSFLKSIQDKTAPEVSGEDGLRALRIALKALKDIEYA